MHKMLNGYLADLMVATHKIRTFHWYVKGPDFFEAHMKLEEYYDEIGELVDEVAETMLMRGMKPVVTTAKIAKAATITEAKGDFITSQNAYARLAKDFKTLLAHATDLKAQAEKDGDDLVAIKADAHIEYFSKAIWMLAQR